MIKVAVFGSGHIGEAICALLAGSGRYEVVLGDIQLERAKKAAAGWQNASGHALNLKDPASVSKVLSGCQAVISALPYYCNQQVAEVAVKNAIHYFDLTEDVATTKKVISLANGAKSALMPQCGLAPGFISIAAYHLASLVDQIESLKLRVGALPIFPSNRMKYNLTWSTEGLINEYGNLCEAICNGQRQMLVPLEGYETFVIDGELFEAFNTSGGLGTLGDTLEGKVRDLDYKTIRYQGHRDLVAFLMQDLRFNSDRETLRRVFERSIPTTPQDKVVIRSEVSGMKDGVLVQKTYASTVYNTQIHNRHLSAIQLTTAAGVCAPLDLVLTGSLKGRSGFIKSEEIPLLELLSNEFGRYFRDEKALSGL
jgi:saccharopine dehydrogenase-like NADP-dependent oxidoreductase